MEQTRNTHKEKLQSLFEARSESVKACYDALKEFNNEQKEQAEYQERQAEIERMKAEVLKFSKSDSRAQEQN